MNRQAPKGAHTGTWILFGLAFILGRPESAAAQNQCIDFPSSTLSTVPAVIVGTASGARVGPGFVAVLRTTSNVPIAFGYLTLEFKNSTVTPFRGQVTPTVPENGFCNMITQRADANGQVVIDARLSGFDNDDDILVYARKDLCCPGYLIRRIKGRSTDVVTSVPSSQFCCTSESTNLADLAYWNAAFLSGTDPQECDFNQDGIVNQADQIPLVNEYFAATPALLCVP